MPPAPSHRHDPLPHPDLDLDLAGLSAAAAPWLARLPVADGRVQALPDTRTLRFYQSTGLLDRPARYDGRVARYGRRHLLQLLAVRVLQSQGLSLAQVQAQLAGATDTELAETVDNALGPYEPATPLASPVPAASRATPIIIAAELVPGVVVNVDSRLHSNPTRVLELLRRAIQGELP